MTRPFNRSITPRLLALARSALVALASCCIVTMAAAPLTGRARAAEPTSDIVDLSKIDGANIDETTIARTIVVDIQQPPIHSGAVRGSEQNPCSSLREAMQMAIDTIDRGTPTRVLLRPGVYRETLEGLSFDKLPGVIKTLLVIEGTDPQEVVLTGADAWPLSTWRDEGDGLYSRPWPYHFGLRSPPWGPKKLIGHRSEMVFVGDEPLRQRLLESYEVQGLSYETVEHTTYHYTGSHKPAEVLKPGEFGVQERMENDPRIFIKLTPEQARQGERLEVATRQRLMDLRIKQNLVLRNLTVTRFANTLGSFFPQFPIDMGIRYSDNERPANVLVENCRFLWNNGHGLNVVGSGVTIRDSTFNYNGFSGINGDASNDVVFENNTTNFNGWRAYFGEEIGWFTAGVKMHKTVGQKVLGHSSIGNTVGGFWYDIHCKDIYFQDGVMIANPWGYMWELSQGPFHGRRLLSIGGKTEQGGGIRLWELGSALVEDSVFWQNYPEHNGSPTASVHLYHSKRSSEQTDEHAQLERITPTTLLVRNSVIATGGDSRVPVWATDFRPYDKQRSQPVKYQFEGNVYHSPRGPEALLWQRGEKYGGWDVWSSVKPGEWEPDLRDVAGWSKQSGDKGSVFASQPPVLGAERWDAQLANTPELSKLRSRLPSYTMPDDVRADMEWFFQWTGFSPTAWPKTPDLDGPDEQDVPPTQTPTADGTLYSETFDNVGVPDAWRNTGDPSGAWFAWGNPKPEPSLDIDNGQLRVSLDTPGSGDWGVGLIGQLVTGPGGDLAQIELSMDVTPRTHQSGDYTLSLSITQYANNAESAKLTKTLKVPNDKTTRIRVTLDQFEQTGTFDPAGWIPLEFGELFNPRNTDPAKTVSIHIDNVQVRRLEP